MGAARGGVPPDSAVSLRRDRRRFRILAARGRILEGPAPASRRFVHKRVEEEDFMSLSRRHFFRNVGLGSAGLLSTPFIIGRGREAMAFEAGALQPPDDGGFIRISSNENARGPGRKTMDALRNTITPRVGRGYPPDYTGDLVATIADIYGVGRDHVIVGTGSGPILEAATRAFCSAQKPLVTAAPTYGTADQTARRIGAPVKMIRVDRSLGLDIDAMAE